MVDILHEICQITSGTLSTGTAIKCANASYDSSEMKSTFLCKKREIAITVDPSQTAGESVWLVCARGDLTTAQVATALEQVNPEMGLQSTHKSYTDKISFVHPLNIGEGTNEYREQTFGGKGVPFMEDIGWAWFLYNPVGNLTTGCQVKAFIRHMGAWIDA